jgi:predicted ArsR family transcriptional regulator
VIFQARLCKTYDAMDLPARPDDALAQPTRARLFSLLAELRRPIGTEELAERLDLHPNGVRVHLERLRDAGLVARERMRQARGRPRDMWLIAADAQPTGEPPSGYVQLGRWLARVIKPGKASLGKVESTGREIGRELAPDGEYPAEAKMHATLITLGFQPRREAHRPGVLTYRLCNCPYREAVRENADAVCTLHRGITRGLLDEIAPTSTLSAFVPHDPSLAGCLVELRGEIAADGLERLREDAQS